MTFLGTRGNIPLRSRQHRRHSAILLARRGTRVLIDCGEDWTGRVARLRPTAILITHAHPDHARGLRRGGPCPVYGTPSAWQAMKRWPLPVCGPLPVRQPVLIAGFVIEACPVQHSVNAPAVGFKVSADGVCLFYVPDVAAIERPRRTLRDVDVYVGDGAVLKRSLVRTRGSVMIGHASVAAQLDWCRAGGVPRAIFTHCGSGIVRSAPGRVEAAVRALGRQRGVDARLAHDGLTVRVTSLREHTHD